MKPPPAGRPELAIGVRWLIGSYAAFLVAQVVFGLIATEVEGEPARNELFFAPWFMGSSLLATGVLAALVLAGAARTPDRRAALGLVWPEHPWRAVGLAVLTVFAGLMAAVALEPVFHGGEEQGLEPTKFPGGAEAGIGLGTAFLAVVVAAPLVEELFFRGAVFGAIRARTGPLPALLVSGALFAGAHFVPAAFPALMVFGVLLAFLYERTGSLLAPVLAHALYNGLALTAALLSP